MDRLNTFDDLETLRKRLEADSKAFRSTLTMCGGTGCQASGSQPVIDAFKDNSLEKV